MFCPKCGTQNPDTGRFCRSCGADLGNVSAALSGKLTPPHHFTNRKGKRITWESAITQIFMGLAFLTVSIVLGVTGMAGGREWWFWLLIPAFGMLGSGIAQCVQLKKTEQQNVHFAPPGSVDEIPAAPANTALPPTQTTYVEPPKRSIYDTGDLVEAPPSVTEETTRHLQIDHEGKTMTLPKK